MTSLEAPSILGKLASLQTELVELAYSLELQGRVDAADVAIATAGRLGELHAELGERGAQVTTPTTRRAQ